MRMSPVFATTHLTFFPMFETGMGSSRTSHINIASHSIILFTHTVTAAVFHFHSLSFSLHSKCFMNLEFTERKRRMYEREGGGSREREKRREDQFPDPSIRLGDDKRPGTENWCERRKQRKIVNPNVNA